MTALPHVTEKQFQLQVRELLALTGFELTYCTYDSRRSPAGFPDLIALRDDHPGTTLAILELKSERGKVTAAQAAWLDAWTTLAVTINALSQNVRVIVGVVWPSDFDSLATQLQERQP